MFVCQSYSFSLLMCIGIGGMPSLIELCLIRLLSEK